VLDLQDNDVYWCTADPGWMTGTSYGIIGPWSLGIIQCIMDAGFSTNTWYKFIEKYKITSWYSSPTAVRSLMKAGDEIIKIFGLSSLRHLGSVGEPLNPEVIQWSERVFGKPFLDTYWQTETGSIMISNFPDMKIKAGSMGKPFPGIIPAVLDP
jgi:acetyl-CoA synthetase